MAIPRIYGAARRQAKTLEQERIRNAAPALLDALEEIVKYTEKYPHDMGFESFAKTKARAAIAAARGEA